MWPSTTLCRLVRSLAGAPWKWMTTSHGNALSLQEVGSRVPKPKQRGIWVCALERIRPSYFQPHPHPICGAQAGEPSGPWSRRLENLPLQHTHSSTHPRPQEDPIGSHTQCQSLSGTWGTHGKKAVSQFCLLQPCPSPRSRELYSLHQEQHQFSTLQGQQVCGKRGQNAGGFQRLLLLISTTSVTLHSC